jgi:hypothetical protein
MMIETLLNVALRTTVFRFSCLCHCIRPRYPASLSLASPRPFGFCKIFVLLRATKFLSKGLLGFHFASSLLPMQLALRRVRGTSKTTTMYEAINPACSKAILARMTAVDLKRHFQYLFKQIGLQTDQNKVFMYENLTRFCVHHAKRRFPNLDLLAP